MSLLNIQNLTYHIGDKTLYQNAEFALYPDEHVGVTGKNGVGKSTLFKLLQNEILPDSGEILWRPEVQVGYLDQHAEMHAKMSVREGLQAAFADLYQLEAEMMAIYSDADLCLSNQALSRAASIQGILESHDFYTLNHRVEAIANGLGISSFGLHTRMGQLSGGQRHKVMLAKLLLASPQVLLLDEPTNYLDTAHVDWLANYLIGFKGAFMVVSHDHAFLNRVATSVCDIDRQKMVKYKGNVEKAMLQKAADDAAHLREYHAQKKHINKLEQFIAKNGAGVNASIANGRKKQLARIERLSAPEQSKSANFSFRAASGVRQTVLAAAALDIGYKKALLSGIDLMLSKGEKIAISGFNGIGKSTLLKTLVGRIAPMSGEVEQASGLKIGYFEQELHWPYPDSTPIQLVKAACEGIDDKAARQHLARFGLSGKLALQVVQSLSGGEQTKVKLCCLALQPTHLLVLDEPTTHLDVNVKSALKQALIEYSGAVIVVSHEREFVEDWPDRIVDVQSFQTNVHAK